MPRDKERPSTPGRQSPIENDPGLPALAFRKLAIFGVGVSPLTMDQAVAEIINAAAMRRSLAVTALAVHGLVEALDNPGLSNALAAIDIVTPDGQPVRWALSLLCQTRLPDRVSGPHLMRELCRRAAAAGIGIYIFGSTPKTCRNLVRALLRDNPQLPIVGVQPDRFRDPSAREDAEDIARINRSGAGIVFVGRGCPRQEIWVAEHRDRLNAVSIAVGAAFDFIAGNITHAPAWMQRAGLEWSWRLLQEPKRLWWRYTRTNLKFLYCLLRHLGRRRQRALIVS